MQNLEIIIIKTDVKSFEKMKISLYWRYLKILT